MVQRTGGMRRKTRSKLSRHHRQQGKVPITAYMQELSEGARVQLVANTYLQNGMYAPRLHGKYGIISGKQGECYKVAITDGGVAKMLIIHPVHLRHAA